jgi:integrase
MASVRKRTWKSGGKTRTAFVADYFDQSGKRRSKQFKKAGDAKDWLAKTVHEVKEGTHTPDSVSITVAQAAAIWIKRCEAEQLEPSTLRQYRSHVALRIVPAIGGIKLARLTKAAVQLFRDRLLETCPSRATARKVLTSFKSILTEAMDRGLVAQNVAGAVRIKKDDRDRALAIPTKEEVRAILEHSGRWYALLLTAASTGMRASELRGLVWDNVDFDKNLVYVRQRADETGTIGPPKSRAGTRSIPLTPEVRRALLEHKLASKWKQPGDLVFGTRVGTVEFLSNIARHGIGPAQRQAGIVDAAGRPRYGLHSLRHFFASWVIEQNFTPKEAQTFLGHASIVLTYDRYGHLFPNPESHHEKFARAAQTFSRG